MTLLIEVFNEHSAEELELNSGYQEEKRRGRQSAQWSV
jgi:hypothetical protein